MNGYTKVIEPAIPNRTGKLPIQAGPGHPTALTFYISFADKGAVSLYQPYELFVTTWQ